VLDENVSLRSADASGRYDRLLALESEDLSGSSTGSRLWRRQAWLPRLSLAAMVMAAGFVLLSGAISPSRWQWWFGAITLLITAVSLTQHLVQHRVTLPPSLLLALNIIGILITVAEGGTAQAWWLLPLLIASAALLPLLVVVGGTIAVLLILVLLHPQLVVMASGSGIAALVITGLLAVLMMRVISQQSDELADLALYDPLTGAHNRRFFLPQARRALAEYERYQRVSTLLLFDVDYFKQVNDRYGHALGDRALVAIVQLIAARIRRVDTVFRLGGEEFAVLVSEADADTGLSIAEEIRKAIERLTVVPEGQLTVSVGVRDAVGVDSAEHWLQQADQAMYRAKSAGRNQTYVASDKADR